MQDLPHHYRVAARADAEGVISLDASGLPPIRSAGPPEFGGPGDLWSPETLLVGAVVDCFILTFRAVARASKLDWRSLCCAGEGELDRVDRTTRFTRVGLRAELVLPPGADAERAERLLGKAEHGCLISNSLACPVELVTQIEIGS